MSSRAPPLIEAQAGRDVVHVRLERGLEKLVPVPEIRADREVLRVEPCPTAD